MLVVTTAVIRFEVQPHRGGGGGIDMFRTCLRCCAGRPLILIDAFLIADKGLMQCRLTHPYLVGG